MISMSKFFDKTVFIGRTGLVSFGTLSKRREIHWELQLFAFVRSFSDGVTFFKIKTNWDRYVTEHTPALQLELVLLNMHNHFVVYKNNFE